MAGLSVMALITSLIIAERVVAENAPVRRISVGRGDSGLLRDHPDLAQDEGHALAKLVLIRRRRSEKRRPAPAPDCYSICRRN